RENYTDVEAIFLTCHSDFTYAKEAIRLKSLNYLLKPIDHGELEEAVQSALSKIKSDRQIYEVETSFIQLKSFHESHMRARFWLYLMTENISSDLEDMAAHFEKYELKYDKSTQFLPILIHIFKIDEEINVQRD